MNAWWREELLNEKEATLLALVLRAHDASARRANISADVVVRTAIGSGNYFQSISAGILTLGGTHGPVEQTMMFLGGGNPAAKVSGILARGGKVPGFGNGFYKDEPDALWNEVDEFLKHNFHLWHDRLVSVTKALHDAGKKIFPNPSAYTAVAAIILGIPQESAAYLLIAGRLAAWTESFQRVV